MTRILILSNSSIEVVANFRPQTHLMFFQAMMSYYPRVKKAIGASEKIFEYVDRKPDVPPEGSLAPEKLEGHVRFNNVTFAYPTRPNENILKV